jgi:transposase
LAFEDGRRNNGQSVIDEDLLQALAELVPQSPQDFGWERPTWTTELFARVLAAETGVVVSPTTVWRMLQILGARWGMAKPIVACPWTKAKKSRRIQAIRRALKKLRRGEVAYYQDEVDIHLNPKIGRDWMLKRQQKAVLTPGKNEKRYLAGALRVDGHRLICVEWHQKNSDLFILLLGKLRDAHPNATKIHLVLDNCKIHSSTKVATFLRHHDGLFVFHFLPPYSPRYNKIERFWRELHANVTRNHRCKTIGQLMREVRRFVRHEAQRRRQTAPLVLRRKQTRKAA